MEEIKAVVVDDDSQGSWSELLVEPHKRGTSFYYKLYLFSFGPLLVLAGLKGTK